MFSRGRGAGRSEERRGGEGSLRGMGPCRGGTAFFVRFSGGLRGASEERGGSGLRPTHPVRAEPNPPNGGAASAPPDGDGIPFASQRKIYEPRSDPLSLRCQVKHRSSFVFLRQPFLVGVLERHGCHAIANQSDNLFENRPGCSYEFCGVNKSVDDGTT